MRETTGGILRDVTIRIAGDALMSVRTATSAGDGTFRIAALPPGDYTISFSMRDFKTHQHRVSVSIGVTTTIDVELPLAALEERLTIAARSGVLDPQSTAMNKTFDARQLADLPGSRSTAALFAAAYAVVTTVTEVGGSVAAIGGSSGAYGTRGSNRPTIEGILVSGIGFNGLTLDYGAFEQAAVLTGSHGAEWPTPGVHVQVVTKSGGNHYRGNLYGDYANRHWQSVNVDRDQIEGGANHGGGLSASDANRLWSYRDVNGDIGGFIVKNRLWWFASLRDQEIATRMVNFPVRPHRTSLTNYSAKGTYRIAPGHTFVAYVQAARNHQPNDLDPGPVGSGLTAATAIHLKEDSTADQHASGLIWKAEWQGIVDDRLLMELRAGQFATHLRWDPYSDAPRFEDTQTLHVSGGSRTSQSRLRRAQVFANASYFKDGWTGAHHFRVGGEAMRWLAGESMREGYPGNILHVLHDGAPGEVYRFGAPSESTSGLWTYAAHATDSWRVSDRVALNLGVRFDGYRVFLPEQEHSTGGPDAERFPRVDNLIDWHVVVPRLGAVFDITGDGRTLAKAAFAQYRVAPGNRVGFNSNPNSNQWWQRFPWSDANNSGVWEQGEEGRRSGSRGGNATESLDPDLQLPLVNEIAGWLERELPGGIGVRTGVVWRSEHDQFSRQNANQPFEAFTVPVSIRDPGSDGIEGTDDDAGSLTVYDLAPEFPERQPAANIVRNVPGSRSEYWTWEVGVERRLRERWAFGAGFSHTWNSDQASGYAGQPVRNNTYPVTPNDLVNTGPGGQHEFTTWTAKAHGTYEAPRNVRVTPTFRHQSGQPFGRTFAAPLRYGTVIVLAEPVGTRRMDNITLFDVRIEKTFHVAAGRRLAAFVDVFNAFNANPAQNVVWSSGDSYLRPISIVPPRLARIGLKLAW